MKSETKHRILGYIGLFLVTFVISWLLTETGHCQVPVAMAPPIHFQFLNASGNPLAGGKVFTYLAGTTTLQNTYVDSTGTTTNADPILLDSTGSPANGSVQTGIFLSNLSWKFAAYDVNNVFQWQVDNVTTYFALLNTANTWTASQTFSSTIIDLLTDNQMIFGTGNQTTLDFPPPASNITLHMPSTADTMVGRATTDTLTNKTLTSPVINTPTVNSVLMQNSPGAYFSIANQNPTGTTLNTLTKLVNAPAQAQIAAITDVGGVVGIAVAGAGNTGSVTIQQSGQVGCVFDGATNAGNYVVMSSTTAGNCHDAGTFVFPYQAPVSQSPLGQVIGRVLSTNGGAGTYQISLFGPEVRNDVQQGCNLSGTGPSNPCGFDSASLTSNQSQAWTVPSSGIFAAGFRVACYVIVQIPATTSSTLPSCNVAWTDASNSVAQTLQLTATNTGNLTTTFTQALGFIAPKPGTTVTFSTAGYISTGAQALNYAVHFKILPN